MGSRRFGYDYLRRTPTTPGMLVPNDQEAEAVRWMFEAFAGGTAICAIRAHLKSGAYGCEWERRRGIRRTSRKCFTKTLARGGVTGDCRCCGAALRLTLAQSRRHSPVEHGQTIPCSRAREA